MALNLPPFLRALPRTTRWIVMTTALGSLFLSLTLALFPMLGLPSPILLMGVGPWTLTEGWFWQIATYWMSATGPMQFGFGLLLVAALDLFFVAQIASRIERRLGSRATAILWVGACLVGGLMGATALERGWLDPHQVLIGNRTGLAALLIVWMMTLGEEVLWFFVAPVRGKWLALGLLGVDWLQLLSHGQWVMLLSSAAAALFGYLLSVVVWDMAAPFEVVERIEAPLRWMSRKVHQWILRWRPGSRSNQAVIIDFRTGEEIRR
jgi:hypothetical protein